MDHLAEVLGNIFLETRKEQFKFWLNAFNAKYKENIHLMDNSFKPSLIDRLNFNLNQISIEIRIKIFLLNYFPLGSD